MKRALAALGLLLIIVSVTPVLRWWTSALSADWGKPEGEILIVLGGDMAGPDAIGLSSFWRSIYTVTEWREHRYRRIIITGKSVAPLMRDFAVSQGVPAETITVENNATSTHESALFVAEMLRGDGGRKVLLTSDFHMGRTLRAFRKAGVEASPIPIPDVRKRMADPMQCWPLFGNLLVETAKVAYYKARGWI